VADVQYAKRQRAQRKTSRWITSITSLVVITLLTWAVERALEVCFAARVIKLSESGTSTRS